MANTSIKSPQSCRLQGTQGLSAARSKHNNFKIKWSTERKILPWCRFCQLEHCQRRESLLAGLWNNCNSTNLDQNYESENIRGPNISILGGGGVDHQGLEEWQQWHCSWSSLCSSSCSPSFSPASRCAGPSPFSPPSPSSPPCTEEEQVSWIMNHDIQNPQHYHHTSILYFDGGEGGLMVLAMLNPVIIESISDLQCRWECQKRKRGVCSVFLWRR